MVLLILGVVLSSGGLWKGLLFHRREWFSRFRESDLSSCWRIRRIRIRKMSSWRVNLRLGKHRFKLVCYLKTCGAWLAWHLLPHQSSWDCTSSPATIHRGQVRLSVLEATPGDSAPAPALPLVGMTMVTSQHNSNMNLNSTLSTVPCIHIVSAFHGNSGRPVTVSFLISNQTTFYVLWERKLACK